MRSVASLLGALACCAAILAGCGGSGPAIVDPGADSSTEYSGASAARAQIPESDWLRFDYDAQRNGVGPAATGIAARDVKHLRLRTVRLPGTVDSSAIELAGVTVRGRKRDVIVVTTTYGRTLALDPGSGRRLWQFTPADIHSYLASSQITTATPIADPGRKFIYAASPDGRIHKLALATGREVRAGGWPVSVTFDATHEKIASALNISGGSLIVDDRWVHRRRPAVPGPCGHDRSRQRTDHRRVEFAVLGPPQADRSAEVVPGQRLCDLGTRRRGGRARHRPDARRHRERAVQRIDRLGRQRARAQPRWKTPCSTTGRPPIRPD